METVSREALKKGIQILGDAIPRGARPKTPAGWRAYIDALSDLTPEQWDKALRRAPRELEWFPSAAELRQLAGRHARYTPPPDPDDWPDRPVPEKVQAEVSKILAKLPTMGKGR